MRTQRRPRAPPFQRVRMMATTNAGAKKRLPLTNGMSVSRNELLNAGLTQRKRVTSSALAQCIRGEFTLNRPLGNDSLSVRFPRDFGR